MTISPTDRLIDSARNRRLHHSLLLHGPSPATLISAAMRIAKALNCKTGRGDDGCDCCVRIDKGVHPDVRLVTTATDRKAISIEQIREIVNDAGLRPYEEGVKVFIIDPADTLSGAAANSLLKTLEEPSRDTTFILLASSADLLLPTIRSRCQMIFIRPNEDEIAPDPDDGMEEEILERLVRFAKGRDYGALLGIAPEVYSGDDIRAGMTRLASVLRDVAAERVAQSAQILAAIPKRSLLDAAQNTVAGIARLNVNADPRLLIEDSLAILAQGHRKDS